MDLNLDHLREWRGRTESRSDEVTPASIAALSATLDRDDPFPRAGDPLPPLWHWLYFVPIPRQSELGPDGHAKRGGFLPPVPLPRRMFAGDRVQFHRPLRVGETILRLSRIVDVNCKQGRTGPLVFVVVRHEISQRQGVAVVEEHDIVYRENPKSSDPAPPPQRPPSGAAWTREIRPEETLLFRYSALTFNGHRIHYDRRYATQVEGYPGLVVHGPLIATLLLELLRRNVADVNLASLSFRAVRPLFDTAPFSVSGKVASDGKTAQLWASDSEGWLAMDATAGLA
ncbi:MAG: acyl-CoA dehydrogenase [Acidobacteria bacterium]|nr:MAG: acyl-CoA dehydrogenase [Acidobacteriota bacterium]